MNNEKNGADFNMMNNIIDNYNRDINLIYKIDKLQKNNDKELKNEIENEIFDWLIKKQKEFSISINFSTKDKNELNKIFWLSNYFFKNNLFSDENKSKSIELIIYLIRYIRKNSFNEYPNRKILSIILSFKKIFFMKINNSKTALEMKKDYQFELKDVIEENKNFFYEIMHKFYELNQDDNLMFYPSFQIDKDYSKKDKTFSDSFELLQYYLIKLNDKEETEKTFNFVLNKKLTILKTRFFYILLNEFWNEETIKNKLQNFYKEHMSYFNDNFTGPYLFISFYYFSKNEFKKFLKDQNQKFKNQNEPNRLNILNYYCDIYNFYDKNKTNLSDLMNSSEEPFIEIKSFLENKKIKNFRQISMEMWSMPINLNSFSNFSNISSDEQKLVNLEYETIYLYSKNEIYTYLLDKFVYLYGDDKIKFYDDNFNLLFDKLLLENKITENDFLNFKFMDSEKIRDNSEKLKIEKKEIFKNLNSKNIFDIYISDYLKIKKITEKLNSIRNKYEFDELWNIGKYNSSNEEINNKLFNEINKAFTINNNDQEMIFIFSKVNINFIKVINAAYFKSYEKNLFNFFPKVDNIFKNIQKTLQKLNKNDSVNNVLKNFNIDFFLRKISIITEEPNFYENNIWIFEYFYLFKNKKNFIETYYKEKVNRNQEIYLLIYLKNLFLLGSRNPYYNIKFLDNVWNRNSLLNTMSSKKEKIFNLEFKEIEKLEIKEIEINFSGHYDFETIDCLIIYFLIFLILNYEISSSETDIISSLIKKINHDNTKKSISFIFFSIYSFLYTTVYLDVKKNIYPLEKNKLKFIDDIAKFSFMNIEKFDPSYFDDYKSAIITYNEEGKLEDFFNNYNRIVNIEDIQIVLNKIIFLTSRPIFCDFTNLEWSKSNKLGFIKEIKKAFELIDRYKEKINKYIPINLEPFQKQSSVVRKNFEIINGTNK